MPSSHVRFILACALPLVAAASALAAGVPAQADLTRDQIRQSVVSSMDPKADPCQDFYRYACGGWLDTTTIPADQARWARSFSTITERNREAVQTILQEAGADPAGDPDARKVGDFYAACMDEPAIEAAGVRPLDPVLAEIAKVTDVESLFRTAGRLHRRGVPVLFGFFPLPDFRNPTVNIGFLLQGGLGMPDRDYYGSEDARKKELLVQYRDHVARMLTLAGAPAAEAAADAAKIVAFETGLARASRPRAEMRDFEKLYNPMDRAGLAKLAPALPWAAYFEATGYPGIGDLSVAVPEFVEALGRLAPAPPAATLRAYLRWHAINAAAESLSKPFVDADFEFYGRVLSGQQEIQPRWKRCVAATSTALGEAIGKVFVAREFPGASKAVALEMIRDVEQAFEANLPSLTWMDEATRGRAVEKARKIANKIGYPDVWRDYSALAVKRGAHFDNVAAGAAFEYDRQMGKIGQPVDRKEWRMTPQMVNAYYSPLQNEIVFPAGILQPPFFHKDFPAALNYGAIGAVMGHELTHGFDDQGRKTDGDGVLREWWEPEVAARFETAAKCVSDQFDTFEVEPGVKVNGKLTLGENIADLGGMKEAWLAYRSWEQRHGVPPPLVEGLTEEQLFFVSWAQTWCSLGTPEFLRQQVTVDPHAPGRFRAVAAPMNSREFHRAFRCEAGDRMVAAPVCTVW
jgi:putative endopeptidase